MTSTAISMPATTARFHDIEAQGPTRQYNPMIARAKMAGMAVVGTAGVIATALLASMDPVEPNIGGRQLQGGPHDHGCSSRQLANIEKAEKAVFISGITTVSGMGFGMLGMTVDAMGSPEAGCVIGTIGSAAFGLGSSALLVSGIIYAVKKREC